MFIGLIIAVVVIAAVAWFVFKGKAEVAKVEADVNTVVQDVEKKL
jgi:hypothetical protein